MFDFTIVVMTVSIAGAIGNMYKKSWGFIVYLFTNGFWAFYNLYINQWPQAVMFTVYFVLAVIGLIRWRREELKDLVKVDRKSEPKML